MIEDVLKYGAVYLLTMLKFIAGPTGGVATGMSYLGTVAVTVAGMMSSVILFTYLGEILRERVLKKFLKPRNIFSRRSRRFIIVWRKFGIFGVAFLTPIIFSPIGGTIVLTALNSPKKKILGFMLFSSVFWSVIFSAFFHLAADGVSGI